MLTASTEHSLYSSYREVLLEHLFAGEIMTHLWTTGYRRVEVLKPQVDDSGYDLVLDHGGVVRHVQLKASHTDAATARVSVNVALETKPSGCVVWVRFVEATLELKEFLWFGGEPGAKLPSLSPYEVGRHTRGDRAERQQIRVLPKRAFSKLDTVGQLVQKLFGDLGTVTDLSAEPGLTDPADVEVIEEEGA